MDDEALGVQLATWLDPFVLTECVRVYETDRDAALAPAKLFIVSGHLSSGDEGSYAELVRQFLRCFRVPSPLRRGARSKLDRWAQREALSRSRFRAGVWAGSLGPWCWARRGSGLKPCRHARHRLGTDRRTLGLWGGFATRGGR